MAHDPYFCPNEQLLMSPLRVNALDLCGYRFAPDVEWSTWRLYLTSSPDNTISVCSACYEEYVYGP